MSTRIETIAFLSMKLVEPTHRTRGEKAKMKADSSELEMNGISGYLSRYTSSSFLRISFYEDVRERSLSMSAERKWRNFISFTVSRVVDDTARVAPSMQVPKCSALHGAVFLVSCVSWSFKCSNSCRILA